MRMERSRTKSNKKRERNGVRCCVVASWRFGKTEETRRTPQVGHMSVTVSQGPFVWCNMIDIRMREQNRS